MAQEKVDISEMTPTEVISMVYELKEINEFLDDDNVERALDLLINIMYAKGSVPYEKVPNAIVELQALATKFAISATYYQTVGRDGTNESHKKNIYYTLKDAFTKLADNLKYLVK